MIIPETPRWWYHVICQVIPRSQTAAIGRGPKVAELAEFVQWHVGANRLVLMGVVESTSTQRRQQHERRTFPHSPSPSLRTWRMSFWLPLDCGYTESFKSTRNFIVTSAVMRVAHSQWTRTRPANPNSRGRLWARTSWMFRNTKHWIFVPGTEEQMQAE